MEQRRDQRPSGGPEPRGPSGEPGDSYLHARDLSGASQIFAGESLHGDWAGFLPGSCGRLCFDVRIFIDGSGNHLDLQPQLILMSDPDGPGGAPPLRARFRSDLVVSEEGGSNPGWHRICASISVPEDGSLPQDDDGSWQMLDGAPDSAWADLLGAVTDILFPIDFTANPAEEVGYDNVCLELDERCSTCMDPVSERLLCTVDGSGDYLYSFRVHNRFDEAVNQLFLLDLPAGVSVQPNPLKFDDEPGGSLAPGAVSKVKQVRIHGAQPGALNFRFSLHDAGVVECCAVEHVIELPVCECAQVLTSQVSCTSFGGPRVFSFTPTLQNLGDVPVGHVLVSPTTDGIQVSQPSELVPPLAFAQTAKTTFTFSGPGAVPGGEACFQISLHDENLNECCAIEQCVRLPNRCFVWDPEPVGNSLTDATALFFRLENLGSSGEDGVEFDLGEVDGFRARWFELDPEGTVPDGAFLRFNATGVFGGEPDHELGELRITDTGEELEIAADYSAVGSPTQRLEVYREGELVQVISGHQGIAAQVPTWPTACGKQEVIIGDLRTACYWPQWDELIVFRIPGHEPIVGDGLRVIAERPARELQDIQSFRLQAARIDPIDFASLVTAADCNQNGLPDDDDIAGGGSSDANGDGVPDECGARADLSTGFDQAAGVELGGGVDDDDWRVVESGLPAKVVVRPHPAWRDPYVDAAWVSVQAGRGRSIEGRRFTTYERCFCLAGDAGAVDLDLEILADDRARVSLNGHELAGPGGRFNAASPLPVRASGRVGDGLFPPGESCLVIEVDDVGGVVTGLLARGSVTAADGFCSE